MFPCELSALAVTSPLPMLALAASNPLFDPESVVSELNASAFRQTLFPLPAQISSRRSLSGASGLCADSPSSVWTTAMPSPSAETGMTCP
jgi:hypothetical protein